MSTVLILGSSGSGKSTSMRALNPETTFVINCLNKQLPFRHGCSLYNEDKKNYIATDRASKIVKCIEAVNERLPHIDTLVIDDITFVMCNEYMRRCQEQKFSKFVDMGANMFAIMDTCTNTRPDLICYLLSHTEVGEDGIIGARTVGKMTNDYVGLGERATVVLHAKVMEGEYQFLTQHDGVSYAKSPIGMFEAQYIPNDLAFVNEAIKVYNQ